MGLSTRATAPLQEESGRPCCFAKYDPVNQEAQQHWSECNGLNDER